MVEPQYSLLSSYYLFIFHCSKFNKLPCCSWQQKEDHIPAQNTIVFDKLIRGLISEESQQLGVGAAGCRDEPYLGIFGSSKF